MNEEQVSRATRDVIANQAVELHMIRGELERSMREAQRLRDEVRVRDLRIAELETELVYDGAEPELVGANGSEPAS